jgi:hypothetical protein
VRDFEYICFSHKRKGNLMQVFDLAFEVKFRKVSEDGSDRNVLEGLGGTQRVVNQTEGMFSPTVVGPITGTIRSLNGNLAAQTLEGSTPFYFDGIPSPINTATGRPDNAFAAHPEGTYPGFNIQMLLEYWLTPVQPSDLTFTSRNAFVEVGGFVFLSYIIKQPTTQGATIHLPITASLDYKPTFSNSPPSSPYWLSTRLTVGVERGVTINLEQQLHVFTSPS